MVNFMLGCFDMLFDILASGNMIIWLSFFAIVISAVFSIVFLLVHSRRI